MYRHAIDVHPDVAEMCVEPTCVFHNFLRRTTQTPAVRMNIQAGEVEPLPGLGRLANNSAREAIRISQAFTSYFSAEGSVSWQDAVFCTSIP